MALVALAVFVVVVVFLGCVVEAHAHKPPSRSSDTLEDLRLAYAPNLAQVLRDQRLYRENERKREYEDYRVKLWLEGHPTSPNEEPTVFFGPLHEDL